MINNAIETPNLSQHSVISNLGSDAGADDAISTKDVLLEAGYTSFEIENAISNYSQQRLENLGKDRPRTHVFSQGKTFTYEKLSVIEPSDEIKKSKAESKDMMSWAKSSLTLPIDTNLLYQISDPKAIALQS